MAPSPVAETTGLTGRCRTFRAVDTLGMCVSGIRGGRSHGQPAGGWPAWYRSRRGRPGEPGKASPPRLSTFPPPRLSTVVQGMSSVFAQILHGLMHRLLSWQPKRPQIGTSRHELREKACVIALHALQRGGQEVTLTRFAC
jgi:hypothetical protein